MKSEKQIKRKRYVLLKDLKRIRLTLDALVKLDMTVRQRGDATYVHTKEREKELMGEINSLNWILK